MTTTHAVPPFSVVSQASVAQLLLRYLQLEGATTWFGIPGGAVMHLLAELKQQRATFRYVIARQETGAAYMADGYARVSGKLGVVLVTSGPGATNALTGTMNAQAAGVPLLTLTGEIAQAYYGMGYLQEGIDAGLDVNAIYGNAAGYTAVLSTPSNAQTLLEQALRDALGRPGRAAHLSLPDDVVASPMPAFRMPTTPAHYRAVAGGCDRGAVHKVVERLLAAQRPLILLGSGAAAALHGSVLAAFTAFVERHAIAVMTTPDAKGVFPESHPLSLRCFGQAFCEWTKFYMAPQLLDPALPAQYDALLVLGTQLGGFTTNKWDATLWPAGALMQIDLAPEVLGRVRPLDIGVVGEIGAAIDLLVHFSLEAELESACESDTEAVAVTARRDFIARIKREQSPYFSAAQRDATTQPIQPAAVMKLLSLALPAGSEIFIDAGNCVGWALHYLELNPPTRVHSALAMGPMGFAVGAVVGAKLAAPQRPCIAICGDGAFLMHGNEVSTAAAQRLGAIWIVLDDANLAMVSQGMAQFFPDASGVWNDYYGLGHNDLAAMARALGADAYRVDSVADLQHALGAALDASAIHLRPQVIVVAIDPQPLPPYYQPPGIPPHPLA